MSDALWAIARTLLVMRKKERVLSLRLLLFIFDIFARYIGLPLFPYSGFYIPCMRYIILWEPFSRVGRWVCLPEITEAISQLERLAADAAGGLAGGPGSICIHLW